MVNQLHIRKITRVTHCSEYKEKGSTQPCQICNGSICQLSALPLSTLICFGVHRICWELHFLEPPCVNFLPLVCICQWEFYCTTMQKQVGEGIPFLGHLTARHHSLPVFSFVKTLAFPKNSIVTTFWLFQRCLWSKWFRLKVSAAVLMTSQELSPWPPLTENCQHPCCCFHYCSNKIVSLLLARPRQNSLKLENLG